MKDINNSKTIMDLCADYNDVYTRFNVQEIIPFGKVTLDFEADQGERFILSNDKNKYLMVETSINLYWVGALRRLLETKDLNLNVSQSLYDYVQKDHRGETHRLFIFPYIEGEPLTNYLKKVDEKESFRLGQSLGEILRKVHALKVDTLSHHIPNWKYVYSRRQQNLINNYVSNKLIDKVYNYYKEHANIIEERYSAEYYYPTIDGKYVYDENRNIVKEKVLSFIFNDIKLENLMVSNGEVFIPTPLNMIVSEPFYEFKFLSLIALENEYFASGIIVGYLENGPSKEFFKMLKYYTSEIIINEFNKTLDENTISKLIDSYNDYELDIPKWYKNIIK